MLFEENQEEISSCEEGWLLQVRRLHLDSIENSYLSADREQLINEIDPESQK